MNRYHIEIIAPLLAVFLSNCAQDRHTFSPSGYLVPVEGKRVGQTATEPYTGKEFTITKLYTLDEALDIEMKEKLSTPEGRAEVAKLEQIARDNGYDSHAKDKSGFSSALGSVLEGAVGAVGVLAETAVQNPQLLAGNSRSSSSYSGVPSGYDRDGGGQNVGYTNSANTQSSYNPAKSYSNNNSGSSTQNTPEPRQPKTLGMVTPIVVDRGQLGMQSSANEFVNVDYRLYYKQQSTINNLGKKYTDYTTGIGPKGRFLTMYSNKEATLVVLRVY